MLGYTVSMCTQQWQGKVMLEGFSTCHITVFPLETKTIGKVFKENEVMLIIHITHLSSFINQIPLQTLLDCMTYRSNIFLFLTHIHNYTCDMTNLGSRSLVPRVHSLLKILGFNCFCFKLHLFCTPSSIIIQTSKNNFQNYLSMVHKFFKVILSIIDI